MTEAPATLATPRDLQDRLGRPLTDAEAARAQALLTDASAMVRAYTGQTFTLATGAQVLRAQAGIVRLPQRPVIAVSSVVATGGSDVPDLPVVGWVFDGIDQVQLGDGGCVINLPESWWDDDGFPDTYRITYSHGYATSPADVVAVVCAMVLRTLTAPTTQGGITSETIGSYSYSLKTADTGIAVSLGQPERQALARYRRPEAMIKVAR